MKNVIRSIPLIAAVTLAALVSTSCTRHARATRRLDHANRYFDSGQYDKAEIEYLNVLQLDRQNPDAIGRLGMILQAEGRVGRSIIYLTKARELRPEDLEVRLKLGLAYLEIGDLKRARDEANFILDRKPQDEQAPLLLAEASAGPKDIEESRKRLQRLPPPAAEGARYSSRWACSTCVCSRSRRRRRHSNERKRWRPNRAGLTLRWATSIGHKKTWRKRRRRSSRPPSFPARSPKKLQYAQFKIQTGDLAAGKRLLEEVTRNTPDYLPAWVWLAEIAATEKKYDESQTLVDKALARDMLQPEALLLSAGSRW